MKRWALFLAAALLTLAVAAGSAGAETRVFRIVPETSQTALPSAEVPERTRRGCAAAVDALPPRVAGPAVQHPERTLEPGRRRLRDPLGSARRDQQDRVELRPEHGAELCRRDRLDAVHALDVGALGNRRDRRRPGRPLERRGCDLLRRAVSRRGRWPGRHLPRRLCVQPRALVRQRRARPGPDVRQRVGNRALARPRAGRRRAGEEKGRQDEPETRRRRAPPALARSAGRCRAGPSRRGAAALDEAHARQELLRSRLAARRGGAAGQGAPQAPQ